MNKFYIIQNNNQLIKILNSIKNIFKNYYNYYSKNKEKLLLILLLKFIKISIFYLILFLLLN